MKNRISVQDDATTAVVRLCKKEVVTGKIEAVDRPTARRVATVAAMKQDRATDRSVERAISNRVVVVVVDRLQTRIATRVDQVNDVVEKTAVELDAPNDLGATGVDRGERLRPGDLPAIHKEVHQLADRTPKSLSIEWTKTAMVNSARTSS